MVQPMGIKNKDANYKTLLTCDAKFDGKSFYCTMSGRCSYQYGSIVALVENEFTTDFDISARHFRRLFQGELDNTSVQVMRIHRLNLVKNS